MASSNRGMADGYRPITEGYQPGKAITCSAGLHANINQRQGSTAIYATAAQWRLKRIQTAFKVSGQ